MPEALFRLFHLQLDVSPDNHGSVLRSITTNSTHTHPRCLYSKLDCDVLVHSLLRVVYYQNTVCLWLVDCSLYPMSYVWFIIRIRFASGLWIALFILCPMCGLFSECGLPLACGLLSLSYVLCVVYYQNTVCLWLVDCSLCPMSYVWFIFRIRFASSLWTALFVL